LQNRRIIGSHERASQRVVLAVEFLERQAAEASRDRRVAWGDDQRRRAILQDARQHLLLELAARRCRGDHDESAMLLHTYYSK